MTAVEDLERLESSRLLSRVFSFDAETDGLYGDVWAIGAVVLDGKELVAAFKGQIDSASVVDVWVREHIVPVVDLPIYDSRSELLDAFWAFWIEHKTGVLCIADFGAPVEAHLFRSCVLADLNARMWEGPYPMHELGTALLLAGIDTDINRREMAGHPRLIQHDPYNDALVAGICWQMATSMAPMTGGRNG